MPPLQHRKAQSDVGNRGKVLDSEGHSSNPEMVALVALVVNFIIGSLPAACLCLDSGMAAIRLAHLKMSGKNLEKPNLLE